MKTIKIELTKEEKRLINNILLENCMSMTDVLREQQTQGDAQNIFQIIQATMACQQNFFSASLEEVFEIPEAMAQFLKPIVENVCEMLEKAKEDLIKKGDKNGFSITSTVESLKKIIEKLPNPSLIVSA